MADDTATVAELQGAIRRFAEARGWEPYHSPKNLAMALASEVGELCDIFRWLTPDRESFRYGDHPLVSIADRVFVECVGGDLTIKVEDNTRTGEGVYSEPVEDRHQKVDDA